MPEKQGLKRTASLNMILTLLRIERFSSSPITLLTGGISSFDKMVYSSCKIKHFKKFDGLANHKQAPWKAPLLDFIGSLYAERQ